MRCVFPTIVAVEKYYVCWVCVCRLRYPACNAHALYYIVICGMQVLRYFPILSHKRHNFQKKNFLLLRCHYSPIQTLVSLMDFSQSAVFLDLSFQFVMWHLLTSVLYSSIIRFFVFFLVQFPNEFFKYLTYFSFTMHSINLTNPIQPTCSDKWNWI